MKALVGAFNQEKALVGPFSVIVKTDCGTDGSFYSTILNVMILRYKLVASKLITFVFSPLITNLFPKLQKVKQSEVKVEY